MYLTVSKREISSITDNHKGNEAFVIALAGAGRSTAALMRLLAQYVQFNSVFGAGVVGLAAAIARSQDIFRERTESIPAFADRSYDVAAAIFFAAIDEFALKKTHRSMAQDTLKKSLQFFEMGPEEVESLCRASGETSAAVRAVTEGYCLNRKINEADLFSAIGFHIGSEVLADQEFNILDCYLQREHPALVAYLKGAKAYSWIAVHTTVEADHYDAALESANCALSSFTGDVAKAYGLILKGLKHFAKVQARFMESLSVIGGGQEGAFGIHCEAGTQSS
jgi:hypothetical protein